MQHDPKTPATSEDMNAARPAPGGGMSRAAIGATLAVCVVLALFAVLFVRGPSGARSSLSSAPSVPASWQTYRDPAGLFSVRLPANWRARLDTGTASFGDRTGSATETDETISFSDPAQGSASAAVYVTVEPIRTDFERHWYCSGFRSQEYGSFHAYPATIMPATWLFESASAHFQLAYMIPGIAGPVHSSPPILTPVPTPTPLPQATSDADQTVVNTILASFQPTGTTPLSR